MYLTPRHICFFARMPTREVSLSELHPEQKLNIRQNLVVKTGPLSKKSRSTKMNTKFWAVLKNEVLSWFESASVSGKSAWMWYSAETSHRTRISPKATCLCNTLPAVTPSMRLASSSELRRRTTPSLPNLKPVATSGSKRFRRSCSRLNMKARASRCVECSDSSG